VPDYRREFDLPDEDVEYLDALHRPWEAVIENGVRWILVHDYPVSEAYTHAEVIAALQIPTSYPDTQIDMVFFHPHLVRTDKKQIPQVSSHNFDQKSWQRWSRHRTSAHPWRRGYDSVGTHLMLVDEWIEREVRRRA